MSLQTSSLTKCLPVLNNFMLESGTHGSLFNACHHQIIYVKVDLKPPLPPKYEREVWQFNRAESDLIKRSIINFDWETALTDLDVDSKYKSFMKPLLIFFEIFIPHEVKIFDSKHPPWFTKEKKKGITKE